MSDRLFVSTHKGLFTVDRVDGDWRISRPAFLGDAVLLCLPLPDNRVWAAMGLGHFGVKVRRSLDGGATWDECGTPTYPPQPEDVEDRDGMGRRVRWRTEKLWALETAGPGRPDTLWCGTLPGGLFRSDDAGDTWHLNRPLWDHPGRKQWFGGGADFPGIHSIAVDPRDSRRLLVGVSCGGVWLSEDDGESWELRADGMRAEYMPPERSRDPGIQDPHLIARCGAEPDVLWAQHHNGIFRSTDGARSWHEIERAGPSTFGFTVAAHPKEPGTAWFVPAVKDECRVPVDGSFVVTRTRDGGKTFDVLREGLPREPAYDLVFRHALDVDESGNRLALGSTTGSLWVSENRGDAWLCVSRHLPPIYAVRFVR